MGGENWACFIGYNGSILYILIFTDADTVHSEKTVTLAVNHMLQENLSAMRDYGNSRVLILMIF